MKQYFKEGRGLRTETTFRNPGHFGIKKGISNFAYLQGMGRHINRRFLEAERDRQSCGFSADSIQRVVQPTVTDDGQKAPGVRFGDPRVMALILALTLFTHLLDGFRNHDLKRAVNDLLGPRASPYSTSQATYDRRRLSRKGLISRRPGTNRYVFTPYGWKGELLYARLDARIIVSLRQPCVGGGRCWRETAGEDRRHGPATRRKPEDGPSPAQGGAGDYSWMGSFSEGGAGGGSGPVTAAGPDPRRAAPACPCSSRASSHRGWRRRACSDAGARRGSRRRRCR